MGHRGVFHMVEVENGLTHLPEHVKYLARSLYAAMKEQGVDWFTINAYMLENGRMDMTLRFVDFEGDMGSWEVRDA